jgi:hypothetical protein
VRLKPEALERELAVDLRSESGAERSTLLQSSAPARRAVGHARRRRPQPRHLSASAGCCAGSPSSRCAWSRTSCTARPWPRAAAGRMRAELATASDLKTLADLRARRPHRAPARRGRARPLP